jgi:hypothetical protein
MTIGSRLRRELVQYAIISAYLCVCFAAVLWYKAAVLHSQGITYAPFGLGLMKALILGKFLLIGQMARLGDRYQRRRMILAIAHKAGLFLLLLLALSAIEQLIENTIHGLTLSEIFTQMVNHLPEIGTSSVIVLLILIPYISVKEFVIALGGDKFRKLLFEYRESTH